MEPICRIKEIYKIMYQFEKMFSEHHGLTINEAMLLCCLKDGEARTAGALCDYVGLSGPRVSRVVTTVEAKGYVCRTIGSHDRRQMLFRLTDEGRDKIERMQRSCLGFDELLGQLKAFVEAGSEADRSTESNR